MKDSTQLAGALLRAALAVAASRSFSQVAAGGHQRLHAAADSASHPAPPQPLGRARHPRRVAAAAVRARCWDGELAAAVVGDGSAGLGAGGLEQLMPLEEAVALGVLAGE